jgi:alkylation response protein AidB-like acyl-CoA dehydrogenase
VGTWRGRAKLHIVAAAVPEPPAAPPLDAVRALLPRVRAAAAETESARRLAAPLVAALAETGVFHLCVPRALGGLEAEPATLVAVLAELAAADGAAGWCAMIGATSGLVSAYLPPAAAREVYGAPGVVTGGVFAPLGRARRDGAGWRLRGRWPFASGCEHCQWLMAGAVLDDGPDTRLLVFPATAARILDTWDAAGLRGTGSHDIAVDDRFVPDAYAVDLVRGRPVAGGALFAFPLFGLLALGVAAVALGIARRAIDELLALAVTKRPTAGGRVLAERGVVQAQVAEAEAAVGAARAYVDATVADAWDAARAAGEIPVALRARLRLASSNAARRAAHAVDLAFHAAGAGAAYATSPLQRCFRDVHVLLHHVLVAPPTWELTGRLLLGLPADTGML